MDTERIYLDPVGILATLSPDSQLYLQGASPWFR